jgi:hypothetical protein
MSKVVRAAVFLVGGLLWFAFALIFVFFVVQYVSEGAGLQFFAISVSSSSVLLGLVHVLGFLAAAGLCFVVGIGLFAQGLVSPVR